MEIFILTLSALPTYIMHYIVMIFQTTGRIKLLIPWKLFIRPQHAAEHKLRRTRLRHLRGEKSSIISVSRDINPRHLMR